MDPLTISAAAGMRARLESLDLLSNNIANSSTAGFKADRDSFLPWMSEEANRSLPDGVDSPFLSRQWTDYSQGTFSRTGSSLDLAIQGRGFFELITPDGPRWTRNGSFQINKDGKVQTAEGYLLRVKPPVGREYRLEPNVGIEIDDAGSIIQGGATVGAVEIMDFSSTSSIQKQGSSYFRMEAGGGTPNPASGFKLMQGYLENANAGAVESSVRLVSVMRQFESLQKATTIGVEMNRRAIEEVARVNT